LLERPEKNERLLEALLTSAERERAGQFRFAKDRERFVAGRGALRWLAASYLGSKRKEIEIAIENGGKPRLVRHHGELPLEFNVAHSGDVVVIAFAMGRRVGVDVEAIRNDLDWREIAKRFFRPEEFENLRKLSGPGQRLGFFRCWTRKEAFAKAVGQGLGLSFSEFHAGVTDLRVSAIRDPEGREYSLMQFEPASDYAGAVATEGTPRRCRLFQWVSPVELRD
jgi:4'-phosphopantetheinyl transferase